MCCDTDISPSDDTRKLGNSFYSMPVQKRGLPSQIHLYGSLCSQRFLGIEPCKFIHQVGLTSPRYRDDDTLLSEFRSRGSLQHRLLVIDRQRPGQNFPLNIILLLGIMARGETVNPIACRLIQFVTKLLEQEQCDHSLYTRQSIAALLYTLLKIRSRSDVYPTLS